MRWGVPSSPIVPLCGLARGRGGPPPLSGFGTRPAARGPKDSPAQPAGRARHLKVSPALPIDSMKVFRITGTFQMGRIRKQRFVKEVAAEDEARAREVLLSEIGSKP